MSRQDGVNVVVGMKVWGQEVVKSKPKKIYIKTLQKYLTRFLLLYSSINCFKCRTSATEAAAAELDTFA